MWTWIILLTLAVLMAAVYMRCKKPLRAMLFGAGGGAVTLGLLGFFTTGLLNWNLFTVLLSLVAGIPGVITAILLGQFLV